MSGSVPCARSYHCNIVYFLRWYLSVNKFIVIVN